MRGSAGRLCDRFTVDRARSLVAGVFAVALLVVVGLGTTRAWAQDDPDTPNTPEFDELLAALAPFQCPQLPSFTVVELLPIVDGFLGVTTAEDVEDVPDTVRIRCEYLPTASPNAGRASISFQARLVGGPSSIGRCTEEVSRTTDDGLSVSSARLREASDISLGYTIREQTLEVVPGFEGEVLDAIDVQLDALIPFSLPCPTIPVVITCPPLPGLEALSTDQASPGSFLNATCRYQGAELRIAWATDRSSADAVQATCFVPAESPRPRVGHDVLEGRAAAVAWYSQSDDPAMIEAVSAAVPALLDQVGEQATTCDGVTVEPFGSPVPPFLSDVFTPERVAGSVIVTDSPLRPTIDTSPTTTTPATTSPPTTVAQTAPPTVPPTIAADEADQGALPVDASVDTDATGGSDSGDSFWTTVLRVGSIVMLVLSLLGVAIALLLMRRESRVRPKLDVARMVIVLVVAVVSAVLLSKDAPLWVVGVAVVVGGALGFVQGSKLALRAVGEKVYARRTAWALVAFAAGLAVTQIAGLANRTGAVTLGIALSFLSAAMTGGTIAGRRPHLADARRTAVAGLVLVAVAGVAVAAMVPEGSGLAQQDEQPATTVEPPAGSGEPTAATSAPLTCNTVLAGERCAATEHLMSLVDWTQVELRAGLFSQFKPPLVMSLPLGLDEIPEPVSQTAEWQRRFDNQDPTPYAVDETITFSPNDEGLCCAMDYVGSGTRGSTEYVAEGQLHDLIPIGLPLSAAEVGGIGGNVAGLPFTSEAEYGFGEQVVCLRYLAGTPLNMLQDGSFTTLQIDGEDRTGDEDDVKSNAKATMSIPCEVPGFTFDAALDMLPPVRDVRATGCPTRQELIPVLAEVSPEVTATATVGELFLSPNEELCRAGSLLSPLQFGSDQPGATRGEFAFEYGPIENATAWGDDLALFDAFTPLKPFARTCAVDEQGRPLPVEGNDRCELREFHQLEEGWLSIVYDNQLSDGPDTIVRASVPWGTFRYVCHHCRPDDPSIPEFLGQFTDFSSDWTDSLQQSIDDAAAADAEFAAEAAAEAEALAEEAAGEAAELADEAGVEASEADIDPDDPPTQVEESAEQLGIDPELADLFVEDDADDDARDAALAALVGLLGAAGVMGTALAETGLSASELASRLRENGIAGLNDAVDDHVDRDGVVDEYGDVLMPDDDGMYTWDDGDSERKVDRAELEQLVATAQQAAVTTEAEHAALMADHERFREESWETLRERVLTETAVEAAAIEMAELERERLRRRGQRLHDVLVQMEGSTLRENMLDFLERNPAPGDDDFWSLREVMRQQQIDQDGIDALGDQSEISMALDGIQEDVAQLAEMAGQQGLATLVRNPEVPVRLGVAYATGGLSEVALAPVDVWNTLHDRADAVLESENRNLTTGEIVSEIAEAVVIEYIGSRLGGAGVEPPPRRPMQLLPENYVTHVAPGQKIPLLHQTGYTADHLQRLTRFSERRGVVPGTRMANQYSAAQIRAGNAIPKPLGVKPKSINELDIHLGARADHLGTVGFFEPRLPDTSGMSDDLTAQVMERYHARAKEFGKYYDEIVANPTLEIRNGRVFDVETGKAFAGDMDLVYLKDAETGEVITGARYRELRDEMIRDGLIEHGAEFNIHADLTEGLTRGTAEYEAAIAEADGIVENVLMPTHRSGAPILEVVDGTAVRGEDITGIPNNAD